MAKLIVDISDKLHKELKMTALKEDKTLRKLVIERLDIKILGLILGVVLLSSVVTPYAFADRFSDWMEIWKKQEEAKAIKYQKDVLHFDYAKKQNKDPGFKTGVPGKDIPKKEITRKVSSNINAVKKHY